MVKKKLQLQKYTQTPLSPSSIWAFFPVVFNHPFSLSLVLQAFKLLPCARPCAKSWWYKMARKQSLTSTSSLMGRKTCKKKFLIISLGMHLCSQRTIDNTWHIVALNKCVSRGLNPTTISAFSQPDSFGPVLKPLHTLTLKGKCVFCSFNKHVSSTYKYVRLCSILKLQKWLKECALLLASWARGTKHK